MCKICEKHTSGEIIEELGVEPIGIGSFEDVWRLRLWLMRDPDDDKSEEPRLNVDLSESSTGDAIADFSIPIKYCPFCGREL